METRTYSELKATADNAVIARGADAALLRQLDGMTYNCWCYDNFCGLGCLLCRGDKYEGYEIGMSCNTAGVVSLLLSRVLHARARALLHVRMQAGCVSPAEAWLGTSTVYLIDGCSV